MIDPFHQPVIDNLFVKNDVRFEKTIIYAMHLISYYLIK